MVVAQEKEDGFFVIPLDTHKNNIAQVSISVQ
jgi:hypothetical protein